MKISLTHLPEIKQRELKTVAETIRDLVSPEKVILFGSHARGDWVDDSYVKDGITYHYKSDYDILVVTEKPEDLPPDLVTKVSRRIRRSHDWLETSVTVIAHDINYMNKKLEMGEYFFVDIQKEGVLLYDTGKYQFATPKILSAEERAMKARNYFKQWFGSANRFYENFEHNWEKAKFDEGHYATGIFSLHQAAERYYMAIILVFTDYKPKLHDLKRLNKKACKADVRFKKVFPNQTAEEKRLFEVLVRAYIDSRYELNYSVDPKDLEWLSERVKLLKELTDEICRERIKNYEQGTNRTGPVHF